MCKYVVRQSPATPPSRIRSLAPDCKTHQVAWLQNVIQTHWRMEIREKSLKNLSVLGPRIGPIKVGICPGLEQSIQSYRSSKCKSVWEGRESPQSELVRQKEKGNMRKHRERLY